MKRLLYISFRITYGIKRWILSRFRTPGLMVLVGLMASGVVGLDTNQTLAYQAFTFLLSILVISVAVGLFFRARFSVHRILPRFGTVNVPLEYR
ncbi:MAG: DUF58 domain-containing protein, partial [Deltaproteobacteria bacterium]|nr:DUF58 domain-containing protein [Deltaproteobacteria bacterium]